MYEALRDALHLDPLTLQLAHPASYGFLTYKNLVLTLWARNVLDEEYVTRGFYFGLEPPAYEDTLYVAYGDPAQFGTTLEVLF